MGLHGGGRATRGSSPSPALLLPAFQLARQLRDRAELALEQLAMLAEGIDKRRDERADGNEVRGMFSRSLAFSAEPF